METGNIIITILFIIMCVAPFIYMYLKNKNSEKRKIKSLEKYANENNSVLSKVEAIGKIAIGIDNEKKHVFFIQLFDEKPEFITLNLADYLKCELQKDLKIIQNNNENMMLVDRVLIHFLPKNKTNDTNSLTFFDVKYKLELNGEIQMAEKWISEINRIID